MTAFRDKVTNLIKEWQGLEAKQAQYETPKTTRRDFGRLGRGLRTHEEAYFRAHPDNHPRIGRSRENVRRVTGRREKDEGRFEEVDYEPLASDQEMPRWRNTAQWARNTMVKEGLLQADSPRGIWEISESGRQWLAQKTMNQGRDLRCGQAWTLKDQPQLF